MKYFSLLISGLILILGMSHPVSGQFAYSPVVDSVIQLSDHQSILLLTRQLAGDTTVQIGNETLTIASRYYTNPFNARAAEFIFQKFEELGYTPEIHTFNNGRGENIIATKMGTRYPEKEFIICGHYDNMPSGNRAPGADDNASGTVAVLEAARLLKNFDFDYTIRFAAWDEEEIGLVGSRHYAQRAASQQQQIIGVLNLDMIAWDSNNDFKYTIATNDASQSFSNDFIASTAMYQPRLNHGYHFTTASDHAAFWENGYPAMLVIEDWDDFNAYYHTPADDIDILNMEYYISLVRASIANIAAQAWDQRFYVDHERVLSGNSTAAREAMFIVTGSHAVDVSIQKPRCYYSTDGLTFTFAEPYLISGDTLRFLIPGQVFGSEVSYYFALQDENASMVSTLPSGGKGINPPGTTPPPAYYSYQIENIFQLPACSANTPLVINDSQTLNDVVAIDQQGTILDVDVKVNITHPNTGDLRLILIGPNNSACLLSNRNGGSGGNYFNTIFDDQATQQIKNATPPYTGRYTPEASLSTFNQKEVSGNWQLKISDLATGHSGQLEDWCVHIQYLDPTTDVSSHTLSCDQLEACFPNPATHTVNIGFSLAKATKVQLCLYNMMGQKVHTLAEGRYESGHHLLVVSTSSLPAGRYFYTLQTENTMQTQSVVIVK